MLTHCKIRLRLRISCRPYFRLLLKSSAPHKRIYMVKGYAILDADQRFTVLSDPKYEPSLIPLSFCFYYPHFRQVSRLQQSGFQ